VIGPIAQHVKAMLAEGIDAEHIRRGIEAWQAKGQHPSVLPSVVNEVLNKPKPTDDNVMDRLSRQSYREKPEQPQSYAYPSEKAIAESHRQQQERCARDGKDFYITVDGKAMELVDGEWRSAVKL
jgi:hypothetical protein